MTREEEMYAARNEMAQKHSLISNYTEDNYDAGALDGFELGWRAADAHQPSPWISVADRLPDRAWSNKMGYLTEDSNIVFAITSSGKLFCNLYYSYELKHWLEKGAGLNGVDRALQYDKVTHWMPIPEL